LRDSSGEPLIAAALLNGNISATSATREIGDFTRKTREKPSATPPMPYASRKRLRPLKTFARLGAFETRRDGAA
jgi:hypothetical protein